MEHNTPYSPFHCVMRFPSCGHKFSAVRFFSRSKPPAVIKKNESILRLMYNRGRTLPQQNFNIASFNYYLQQNPVPHLQGQMPDEFLQILVSQPFHSAALHRQYCCTIPVY